VSFSDLLGHHAPRTYLEKALATSRLPHTLLFTGPSGVGKKQFALATAAHLLRTSRERLLNHSHPDFFPLQPEGKSAHHTIERFREAIALSHTAPFEAPAKVFLIEEADRMQPAAANALLKTLEEPPPHTYFFLLATAPQDVLPTILSRAIRLSFQPLADADIATLLARHHLPPDLAPLAAGSIGNALEWAAHPAIQEQRSLLLSLLDSPSPPLLISTLHKIDALQSEDDPLLAARQAALLFHALLFHRRSDPASLPEAVKRAEQAQEAYARNLKLSHCLQFLLAPL
jgi:DNA polymerase-3 subunit delta'